MSVAHIAQYVAARSVLSFMHCFNVETNLTTAARIGSFVYHANRTRRERTEGHIARCFPDWPADRVRAVGERSFEHMMQMFLVDAVLGPRLITPNAWPQIVRLGNLQTVLDLLLRHEPVILLTGHCGNWELMAHVLAVIGYPVHALARPLDNPYLNNWLMGMREARGTRIITKWGAVPIVQDVIRTGGRVAFIADQNAGDRGVFVPFFGRLASSYKSIALLAMRHRVPVVAGFAQRLDRRFRYEMSVTDIVRPADWDNQPDPLFYITARFNRAIESMVRAVPEQYLWVHRRWKSRPPHEREGRPFPDKLRAKLESLPWMTQEELDRIMAARD
jgi:KDO2-lipid IV(A) lauroyltransferase